MPTPKMILLHSGNSQVTLLTAGSSGSPISYNKFAYSNSFLPNYNTKNPVDNMLLLRSVRGKWCCRSDVLENSCRQNICDSKWKAGSIADTTIKTTLIGRTDGYVAIHQLCGGSCLFFKAGGFPIIGHSGNIMKQIKRDEIVLQSKDGAVGIKLIYGNAEPSVLSKSGVNPAGKCSIVPYFKGKFDHTGEVLVFAVWADRNKEPMKLPLVEVGNKECKITWPEEEPIFLSLQH
jgi:hypothetical protein